MSNFTLQYGLMAEALGPLGTYEIAEALTNVVKCVERGVDQVYVIAKAAIHQHKIQSKYHDAGREIHMFGSPLVMGKSDAPFAYVSKYPRVARLLSGRPVNLGFYGGEVYLHTKYMGVGLSSSGEADVLRHFHVPKCANACLAAKMIRHVYIMFRNMLRFGVPPDHLERIMYKEVVTITSPFATQQVAQSLHVGMMPLVASLEVMEKVIRLGAFENLEEEDMADAEFAHAQLTSVRLYGAPSGMCPIRTAF